MNSKLRWVGLGLAFFLLINGNVQSQEGQTPELKTLDLRAEETEETILKEKVNALESAFEQANAAYKAAMVPLSAVLQSGCELSLARAELAAAVGNPQQQIKHLQEALYFAENHVEVEEQLFKTGHGAAHGAAGPLSGLLAQAVVRRADVKLALLRAKQRLAGR